jgi:hypothetical protein
VNNEVNTTMIELKAAHTARQRYAPLHSHLLPKAFKMAGIHAEMGAAALLVQATEVNVSALNSRNKEVWCNE